MHSPKLIKMLERKSRDIRLKILEIIYKVQSGHLGGSFSAADIVTCLYYHHMHIDPSKPNWEDRDRFILSKGHAAPLIYVILADLRYFPKTELDRFRQIR